MISFFSNVFLVFGGVYFLNRLLYRFYFPKKPKFLPLQQLLLEYSKPKKIRLFNRNNTPGSFYKITVNLDDHNRLINPLLMPISKRTLIGNNIFRAYLNVMLPRYNKSIYILNSNEFLHFCEKKSNLYSLGKNIAFAETLELAPELIRSFHKKGPMFFQICYSLNEFNKKKILTIVPTNITTELQPKFYKIKINLLHEDDDIVPIQKNEGMNQADSQYLNIFMDHNDVILGKTDSSFIIFYLNEKNELNLAFLASNRPYFISCYQNSFQKMLQIMLKNEIFIEKTKFIDVHNLIYLIEKKKLIEMFVLSDNGLLSAINEILAYGKTYNLPHSDKFDSLFTKIFSLQRDMMKKKVNPRFFNQDVKKFWL